MDVRPQERVEPPDYFFFGASYHETNTTTSFVHSIYEKFFIQGCRSRPVPPPSYFFAKCRAPPVKLGGSRCYSGEGVYDLLGDGNELFNFGLIPLKNGLALSNKSHFRKDLDEVCPMTQDARAWWSYHIYMCV